MKTNFNYFNYIHRSLKKVYVYFDSKVIWPCITIFTLMLGCFMHI